MTHMFCPRCAKRNDRGARFCRQCGLSLRLIPEALEGKLKIDDASIGWWRPSYLALVSLLLLVLSATLAFFYDTRPDPAAGMRMFGLYLTGLLMFATAGSMAYFKLHPSVQIRYRGRIKELVLAVAAALSTGAVMIGSHVIGLPWLGVALSVLILGAAVPAAFMPARAISRAQREAESESEEDEEEDEEDEEDESESASVTERIAERREAWQLEPPPSVVSMTLDDAPDVVIPDALETGKLPPLRLDRE